MNDKPPPHQRTFADEWDEIGYLYDKLLYWLYQRADRGKARPYARRLERLLPRADPDHNAIFGEECWSLVHETNGDLRGAIKYREHELRLIQRLYEASLGKPYEGTALKGYGYDDWSDRLDLLAILYHDGGELDKAINILKKSKKLCEAHGTEFDGEDVLQEYVEEKRNPQEVAAPVARPRRSSRR
jgi:hypothetical protein